MTDLPADAPWVAGEVVYGKEKKEEKTSLICKRKQINLDIR
jgi:hypothetical protein